MSALDPMSQAFNFCCLRFTKSRLALGSYLWEQNVFFKRHKRKEEKEKRTCVNIKNRWCYPKGEKKKPKKRIGTLKEG